MNTAAHVTLMFVAVMVLCHQVTCLTQLCSMGTFLWTPPSGPDVCVSCTEGVNFMSQDQHTNRACFDCTKIQDPDLEILVTECNTTHDAVILCRPGYYRHKGSNRRQEDFCKKCYECENPTLPCHDTYDTVCCGYPNYEAVLNNDDVYVCQELPIVCQPGQYLDTSTEQCRTCPSGTYMTEDNHNNTACNICQTPHSHQVILQACNSTHPTINGCEDGYFRDRVLEQTMREVICLPCRTCQHYEGRACDMFHNTVCCSGPHMIVVDTDDGPECRSQVKNQTSETTGVSEAGPHYTVCEEDQHLSTNLNDRTVTCLPCKPGTYMDQLNHTMSACKNCIEFKGENLPVLCQHNTDRYWRTSQGYRWSLTIITLLPAIIIICVIVIIKIWQKRGVLVKVKRGGRDMKIGKLTNAHLGVIIAPLLVIIAHLVVVALLLVTAMFSPDDVCFWSVLIVALMYIIVSSINIIQTFHNFCQYICFLIDKNRTINVKKTPKGGEAKDYESVPLRQGKKLELDAVQPICDESKLPDGDHVVSGFTGNEDTENRPLMRFRSQEVRLSKRQRAKEINAADAYNAILGEVQGLYAYLESAINQGADVNATLDDNKKTLLMYAAEHGRDIFLRFLLSRHADVNMRDMSGNTALIYAAQNGSYNCVKELMDFHADINIPNNEGVTPLMMAFYSYNKNKTIPMLLTNLGADVHKRDNDGNTTLIYAVKTGHADWVKALIRAGANKDINLSNNAGETPVMVAVSCHGDNDKLLHILIDAGADVNMRDNEDNTFFNLAKKFHNKKRKSALT